MSGFSISVKKTSGRPVSVGNLALTPISQAVVIRLPGQVNGLIWNRPVAVRVQAPGEEAQVRPIYDYTRLAQILILGAGLLGSALIWIIFRKETKNISEK